VYLDRDINHAIQIGLGIGTVPTFLRGNGIRTDVVEISRGVVKQAADHFLYEWCEEPKECQNGNTFIKDGLNFLKEIPSSSVYDLFLIDVYTGWNPMAFFTQEIIQNIKTNWLKEKGVFGMNFVGYHNGPHTLVMHSIYKTLLTVFPFVKAFRYV
jgi:spermidine synthase